MAFSYRVSLQARHPSADPQAIAASIGLTPLRCWAAGDPRTTPTGAPLGGSHDESYCTFEIGSGEDGELAALLRETLDRLDPVAGFLSELRRTGGRVNFFVTWSPGERGELFDVALLADMARLGVDLGIEPTTHAKA